MVLKEEVLFMKANVAQLAELLICNQLVGGSTPSAGSIFLNIRKSTRKNRLLR